MKKFVNLRLDLVEEYIDLLNENSIGAEIYIPGNVLDEYLISRVEEIGELISQKGLIVNVHGPYSDLNAGYCDNFIRESVIRRFNHAIEIASALKAGTIVFHSGYRLGLSDKKYSLWFSNCLRTWEKVLSFAIEKGISVAIENIHDEGPGTIRRILDYFNSDYLTHCFDIGHFNLFSENKNVSEWIDIFHDKISIIHVHDNNLVKDEHLALGKGKIDFKSFFSYLKQIDYAKAITIENQTKESIILSVEYLKKIYS